ncbi:MAG TPA: phosphopantetheine-binding protein [Gammaproteobacteria bacterium]|nr:phosphopantetheine-binding protein [Gammaproteobacteria bacterium]
MTESQTLESEVAVMLVEAVNLDVDPADINPDEPLFGDQGLGLDSIDALELSLAIAVNYGFEARADDAEQHKAFANLRSLAQYIQAHRTK